MDYWIGVGTAWVGAGAAILLANKPQHVGVMLLASAAITFLCCVMYTLGKKSK